MRWFLPWAWVLGSGLVSTASTEPVVHLDAGAWTPRIEDRLRAERPDLSLIDTSTGATHRVTVRQQGPWLQLTVLRLPETLIVTRALAIEQGPRALTRLTTLLILRALDAPPPRKAPDDVLASHLGLSAAVVGVWWQSPFLPQPGLSLGLYAEHEAGRVALRVEWLGGLCCRRSVEGLTAAASELAFRVEGGWALTRGSWVPRLIIGSGVRLVSIDAEPRAFADAAPIQNVREVEVLFRAGLSLETRWSTGPSIFMAAGAEARLFAVEVVLPAQYPAKTLRTGAIVPWIEIGTLIDFF